MYNVSCDHKFCSIGTRMRNYLGRKEMTREHTKVALLSAKSRRGVRLDELIDAFDVLATGRAEPISRRLPIFKHGGIVVQGKCELQIRYYAAEIMRSSYLRQNRKIENRMGRGGAGRGGSKANECAEWRRKQRNIQAHPLRQAKHQHKNNDHAYQILRCHIGLQRCELGVAECVGEGVLGNVDALLFRPVIDLGRAVVRITAFFQLALTDLRNETNIKSR